MVNARRLVWLGCSLGLAGAALAGCGGDDDEAPEEPPAPLVEAGADVDAGKPDVQVEAGPDTSADVDAGVDADAGPDAQADADAGEAEAGGPTPAVTWLAPATAQNLCASDTTGASCVADADGSTAGWQGQLKVHVEVNGAPLTAGTVTFDWGSGTANGTLDANGDAVATASLADAASVSLKATVTDMGHVGSATVTPIVDTVPPGGVTGVTATFTGRRAPVFHVSFASPADQGNAVSGYDVRWSKSGAVDANNFATLPSITGPTPTAPGTTATFDATGVVENDYYFGVAATDAVGNHGPIGTAGPFGSRFRRAVVTGSVDPTNGGEYLGWSADGSSDLDGDGYSDVAIGALNGTSAYIYFGAQDMAEAAFGARKTTITGQLGFGVAVAVVGDVDGDGLSDLAVGSPYEGEGKVYVVQGRATWPATMAIATEVSAGRAYVISADAGADAGFGSSQFGVTLARLGDFDGDGNPDFAIGATQYSAGSAAAAGYVAIVRGVPNGTAFGSPTLPGALGTRAFALVGGGENEHFGSAIAGLGTLYAGGGTTMVVGANGAGASSQGRAYAFAGPFTGTTTQPIAASSAAKATLDGQAAQAQLGATVTLLGNIGGSSAPDIGIGAPFATGAASSFGTAFVHFGDATGGPFSASPVSFTDSLCTGPLDGFGNVIVGGGFSGTAVSVSFVGDAAPDLVLAPIAEANGSAPPHAYVFDGATTLPGGDVATSTAWATRITLPANWRGGSPANTAIRDLDGDGFADLFFGEQDLLIGDVTYPGRAVVLW